MILFILISIVTSQFGINLPNINLNPSSPSQATTIPIPIMTSTISITTTETTARTFTKTSQPTITLIPNGVSFQQTPQDTSPVIKALIVGAVLLSLIFVFILVTFTYRHYTRDKKVPDPPNPPPIQKQESQNTVEEPVPKLAFYSLRRWTRVKKEPEPVVVQVDPYQSHHDQYGIQVDPINNAYGQYDRLNHVNNLQNHGGVQSNVSSAYVTSEIDDFVYHTPKLNFNRYTKSPSLVQDELKDEQLRELASSSSVVS